MSASKGLLTPAQERALQEVQDCCRRAAPHLAALRIAGVPMEQEEARLQHLMNACEGLQHYHNTMQESEGN